jgi:hypothetical protein
MTEIIDISAFAPARRRVRIRGTEYEFNDVLDMDNLSYIALVEIEQRTKDMSEADAIAAFKEQIAKVIPDLPAPVLDALTLREIGLLLAVLRTTSIKEAGETAGPLSDQPRTASS